jgi:hypothetical protein
MQPWLPDQCEKSHIFRRIFYVFVTVTDIFRKGSRRRVIPQFEGPHVALILFSCRGSFSVVAGGAALADIATSEQRKSVPPDYRSSAGEIPCVRAISSHLRRQIELVSNGGKELEVQPIGPRPHRKLIEAPLRDDAKRVKIDKKPFSCSGFSVEGSQSF